jgi:hypothetical protein
MKLEPGRLLKAMAMTSALAIALITAGCYVGVGVGAADEYEVDGPPPALQGEVLLESPGPEFLWIPGYWDWDLGGRTYVWKAGRWERPPRARAHWEGPHFETRHARRYYRPGRWRD